MLQATRKTRCRQTEKPKRRQNIWTRRQISQQSRKRKEGIEGKKARRVWGLERVTHPSVEREHIFSPLSDSLSRAEAICTWVLHQWRQPSHNYPQRAVATSVTHGKAGPAVKLCMLHSALHLSPKRASPSAPCLWGGRRLSSCCGFLSLLAPAHHCGPRDCITNQGLRDVWFAIWRTAMQKGVRSL